MVSLLTLHSTTCPGRSLSISISARLSGLSAKTTLVDSIWGRLHTASFSQSLEVDSDRKPSFCWRILIRSAPHSHQATAWR